MLQHNNTDSQVRELLRLIGFRPEDNEQNIWAKTYNSNYTIKVDFNKKQIDYGNKIKLDNRTTNNFKISENFVVLECVNKLIEKGYKPWNITLEKTYTLGHRSKGKLDILILDSEAKAYLMIECKTYGDEFEKATQKTISTSKSQLFSYYQQDQSAKYLCLYTSKLNNNRIEYKNNIIEITKPISSANNVKEAYNHWNTNFKTSDIFEGQAYNIKIKALKKGGLKPLTKDGSSKVFNQFAEILRHNVVSDKPNAFNKLITLLLCKIVDEDKGDNEELDFQWKDNDSNISLQKRLNDLYKIGMQDYLNKKITDYSDKDVDKIIGLTDKQQKEVKKMITDMRLKKNNEFAFKEVFNDDSFNENAKVLKEVVKLFQPYRMRYNKKHQFLGEFFELLLNTSIKQEAGQFFTPTPIAKFIVNSIPFREIINNKIKNGDLNFLPYVIDFACGSGHFLTEVMDEINTIISELNKEAIFRDSTKKRLGAWKSNPLDWAFEYIYGVDNDYRLVKTSKVSCFLNGDGLARVINADGLAPFNSKDYQEKLYKGDISDKDLNSFDVLIANPPYSVSAFKNTLDNGAKSFELYDMLTDNSSEIECLFIERMKQLLKEGGYAGIILPSSILSNTGIYIGAREIILKYFRIIGIVELGSSTFMATGTNTVILFLERLNKVNWEKVKHSTNDFIKDPRDFTCNGIENVFSKYVGYVYSDISFEDYVSLISKSPNGLVKEHDLYKGYLKEHKGRLDYKKVLENEKEKLLYFILTYPQKVIVVKTGEKQDAKSFLGYEFSNRRGHEGIKYYRDAEGKFVTILYGDGILLNNKKVNTYIYNAFLSNDKKIDNSLSSNVFKYNLVDMLTFDKTGFTKSISLNIKKKLKSKWQLIKLHDIVGFEQGIIYDKSKDQVYEPTNKTVFTASNINLKTSSLSYNKAIYLRSDFVVPESKYLKANDIFICTSSGSLSHIGKVAFIDKDLDIIFGGFCAVLRSKDYITSKYIFSILKSNIFLENLQSFKSQNINNLSKSNLLDFKIPMPPKEVQEKIVKEVEVIENKENESLYLIKTMKKNIENKINKVLKNTNHQKKLTSLIEVLESGSRPKGGVGRITEGIPSLGGEHISLDGTITFKNMKYVSTEYFSKARKGILYINDILICKDGALTGKVAILKNNFPYSRALINEHLFLIRSNSLVYQKYLFLFLYSGYGQSLLRGNMTGAAQGGLNRNNLLNIKVLLPPREEQEKIINEVEKIEKEIEGLKAQLQSIDLDKRAILDKYLQNTF